MIKVKIYNFLSVMLGDSNTIINTKSTQKLVNIIFL